MTDIDIPAAQKSLFNAVKSVGKPVVILLVTGRPMTIAPETESADGLLVTMATLLGMVVMYMLHICQSQQLNLLWVLTSVVVEDMLQVMLRN